MNDSENIVEPEVEDNAPDELEALKQRASMLGVKFSPNIGVDKLRAKVDKALSDDDDDEPEVELTAVQRKAKVRQEMKLEQTQLIRCRIQNMNPDKRELPGEIWSVSNKYLGTIKKFVAYGEGSDEGYHVPKILLEMIRTRKFLQITTKPKANNKADIDVKTRWVPEFAIQELPPLTAKELADLAASQAAAGGL